MKLFTLFIIATMAVAKWHEYDAFGDSVLNVKWIYHEATSAVEFEVTHTRSEGENLQWVGIGFSSSGSMYGAEYFIYDPTGTGKLMQKVSYEKETPMDVKNPGGFKLHEHSHTDTEIKFRFTRFKESVLSAEFDLFVDRDSWLIHAYGNLPFEYHGLNQRTSKLLNFKFGLPVSVDTIKDQIDGSQDFTMKNYPVGQDLNSWWCKFEKLDPDHDWGKDCDPTTMKGCNLPPRKDLIAWSPKLDKSSEHLVHHMILYLCPITFDTLWNDEKTLRAVHPEIHKSIPINTKDHFNCRGMPPCQTVVAVTTKGTGDFIYPKDYSRTLGAHHGSTFVLEMHYYNPMKEVNTPDSSGFTLHFSDTPKEKTLGVSFGGVWYDFLLVPPFSRRKFVGYHPAVCSKKVGLSPGSPGIHGEDVSFLQWNPHMHLTGFHQKAVVVDSELKQVGDSIYEHFYDYNIQASKVFKPRYKYDPTKDIKYSCIFKNDKNITVGGGEGSNNEMCFLGGQTMSGDHNIFSMALNLPGYNLDVTKQKYNNTFFGLRGHDDKWADLMDALEEARSNDVALFLCGSEFLNAVTNPMDETSLTPIFPKDFNPDNANAVQKKWWDVVEDQMKEANENVKAVRQILTLDGPREIPIVNLTYDDFKRDYMKDARAEMELVDLELIRRNQGNEKDAVVELFLGFALVLISLLF